MVLNDEILEYSNILHNAISGVKSFGWVKTRSCKVNEITRMTFRVGSSYQWHDTGIHIFFFCIFFLLRSGTSQECQLTLQFYDSVFWGLANEIQILGMGATEHYLQGIRLFRNTTQKLKNRNCAESSVRWES